MFQFPARLVIGLFGVAIAAYFAIAAAQAFSAATASISQTLEAHQ